MLNFTGPRCNAALTQAELEAKAAHIDSLPSVGVDYLNELLKSEHQAFIAGGYARDLFHGREPRDIDYWIEYKSNGLGGDNLFEIISRLMEDEVPFVEYNMYGVDDDRGRLAVYKIPGADLIFVENVEQAVKDFDYNLNQFYIEPEAGPIYVGEGDPADGLVQLRFDERCNRRREKMEALWEEFYGKVQKG